MAGAVSPKNGERAGILLALACLAQFMVVLDVSIVNVALPSIRHDIGFSPTGLQWVVNAYTLAFAGFLLLGGRAADLIGRRAAFMGGLGLFGLASLAGGLAHGPAMLLGARTMQGLAGAVLSPATLTIITTTFKEGAARAKAMGAWSAVAGAGGAVGALAGGSLTTLASWRWIFFINVPLALLGIVGARIFLTEIRRPSRAGRPDVLGAIVVTAGLAGLVLSLVRADSVGWGSTQTVVTMGVSFALLLAFIGYEYKVPSDPLVPLGMFRSRSLTGANLVMLGVGASLFATWYFLSLYFQYVLHYSPLLAGVAFVPQTVAVMVGSQVSSRLVSRVGARPLLVIGPLVSAVGLLFMSQVNAFSSFWGAIFVPSVLVTLGGGLSFAPVAVAATSGIRSEEAGLASGLVNTSRQVGGAIGLAGLASLATWRSAHFSPPPGHVGQVVHLEALSAGFTAAFAAACGIAVLTAVAAFIVPPINRGGRPPRAASAPSSQDAEDAQLGVPARAMWGAES